jgi:hypothetical protein
MVGPERHLVESCSWTECSDVMFNAYTPGVWLFQSAHQYESGTAFVYAEGPVSLDEALQAAEEGRPNPLSDEQLDEGLAEGRGAYRGVSGHLMAVKNHYWFALLFTDQLGWDLTETGRSANFEPRYLQALVTSHPIEVETTWERVLLKSREEPAVFEAILQWGNASSR